MHRAAFIFVVIALVGGAARARAQIPGMPVWNSPRGGSRLFFAADAGYPDSIGGKGSVYAVRAAAGFSGLTVSATAGSRSPSAGSSFGEYGGTVAYRVVGGSLIPVAVNLQVGAAFWSESGRTDNRYTGAVGISVDVPVPYVTLEPWVAPGVRLNRTGASGTTPAHSDTEFGWAAGITFGFGAFGVHTAYNYEKLPSGYHTSTLGIGVHVDIRPALGL